MTTESSNADCPIDDLDRYVNGDQSAFLRLWEHHCDKFAGWLRLRLGKDEHTAEDLLNDAAAKLMTPSVRAQYARNKPWGGWAFTILRNLTFDYLRRRARGDTGALDPESLADSEPSAARDGLAGDLDVCLKGLPARFRELMVQRYLENRQQTDIAHNMAISTATVSKNLDRARTLLAQCLEEKGHGDWLR